VSVDLVKAREVGDACRSRGALNAAAYIFDMAAEIETLRADGARLSDGMRSAGYDPDTWGKS
jgi:hypothetical protein